MLTTNYEVLQKAMKIIISIQNGIQQANLYAIY